MSTRSRIGYRQGSKVISIYCHFDGYVEGPVGVGYKLNKFYKDENKILTLLSLGDLSSLGEIPEVDTEYWKDGHEWDGKRCGTYKDRGEKHVNAKEDSYDSYSSFGDGDYWDIDYLYLFENGKWKVKNSNKEEFIDLDECKEGGVV